MRTVVTAPRSSAGRATDREVGVVAAVLVAGSEKAAAHRLGLSHSTVKHHLANARYQVGAATTAQLVWILAPRLPEHEGTAQSDEQRSACPGPGARATPLARSHGSMSAGCFHREELEANLLEEVGRVGQSVAHHGEIGVAVSTARVLGEQGKGRTAPRRTDGLAKGHGLDRRQARELFGDLAEDEALVRDDLAVQPVDPKTSARTTGSCS